LPQESNFTNAAEEKKIPTGNLAFGRNAIELKLLCKKKKKEQKIGEEK